MLYFFLAILMIDAFSGESCLTANNANGPPPLVDYRDLSLNWQRIYHGHQAIIPSYQFTCHGAITQWGVDVDRGGYNSNETYTLDLQVWRPSPTVQLASVGCYSLVGHNVFTSVLLSKQLARVTPLPRERIEFRPGDVLGFSVENIRGGERGVVITQDSSERGDRGYETEEVWYARKNHFTIDNGECPLPVGSNGQLNTFTKAAPVISVSYYVINPTTTLSSVQSKPSHSAVTDPSQITADPPQITGVKTDPTQTTEATAYLRMTKMTIGRNNDTLPDEIGIGQAIGIITAVGVVTIILLILFILLVGYAVKMMVRIRRSYVVSENEPSTAKSDATLQDNNRSSAVSDLSFEARCRKSPTNALKLTEIADGASEAIDTGPNEAYVVSIGTERNEAYGMIPQHYAAVHYSDGNVYD